MKHLLLYDSTNDRDFKIVLENMLSQSAAEEVIVECGSSISELLHKSLFGSTSGAVNYTYDVFIVSLQEADVKGLDFVRYVASHKPGLPILLSSPICNEWQIRQIIGKAQKDLTRAADKQDLLSKIRMLLRCPSAIVNAQG